jgi:hypothetical protein
MTAKLSASKAKTLRTLIELGGKVDVTDAIPGINRAGIIGMSKQGLLTVDVKTCMVEVLPAGYECDGASR